jgi:DNA repair protein RadC
MLNSQNNIITEQEISKGILDAAIIDPRAIFNPAIKNSASKIILIHNHPSGNPEPSQEDLDIMDKLEDSGKGLGIKVLDFIIVGREEFWKKTL